MCSAHAKRYPKRNKLIIETHEKDKTELSVLRLLEDFMGH